ncbi:hypothetical protein PHSC3_000964 [Chlamydiales bacterium STE3]|nr:hypothetical protein PHSC3_000964 [Chlamydiales bacterium STE3]
MRKNGVEASIFWAVAYLQKGQFFITNHPKHPSWQYLMSRFMASDYVKKHRFLNEEILRILQTIKQFSYLRDP